MSVGTRNEDYVFLNANKTKIFQITTSLPVTTFWLRPFSFIYGKLLDFRNYLYDSRIKKTYQPFQRTISVGNLTVGGTGKTPMIEFLVRQLLSGLAPADFAQAELPFMATLSRGYGRKSKGFRLAMPTDTADTLGDEPLQLYRKFGQQIKVAVAERRAEGLHQLAVLEPSVKLILLDDAFQHRAVQPHLNILLTDYNRLFTRDQPFPEGRLRENRLGARRADLIVVTKCPNDLSPLDRQQIIDELTPYKDTSVPIFFASLAYDIPKNFDSQELNLPIEASVLLVSGLANADPLENYVRQQFRLIKHHRFSDHFDYSRATLEGLLRELPENGVLLTTEKDWVKLDALLTREERAMLPLYYLPVGVRFLDAEESFLQQVRAVAFPKNA